MNIKTNKEYKYSQDTIHRETDIIPHNTTLLQLHVCMFTNFSSN